MSKEYLPVRLSHLLRHCSVGSIVRGPDYLMTVKDIREWIADDGSPAGHIIPYVDQVRAALDITQVLREPPTAKKHDNGRVDGISIPAVRFPSWMRCPSCGLLHYKPWRDLKEGERAKCNNDLKKKGTRICKKNPELEQVSWILGHEDGHLADVPWHYLAHVNAKNGTQRQCRFDWEEPYLYIKGSNSSRNISCDKCNATDRFSDSLRIPFKDKWRQPWLRETPPLSDELAVVLEVNDARVHTPTTSSALVIPPESRVRKGSVTDRLYSSSEKQKQIKQARNPLARKGAVNQIAREFRCSADDIDEALSSIENGYPLYGENITQGILLEREFEALTKMIPDIADDEDFVTKHYSSDWKALQPDHRSTRITRSIDQLIAVDRLKEVMVLRGFQRLGGKMIPPDIVDETNWLPALELYGEGIFFTFNEENLKKWENNEELQSRVMSVERRFEATDIRFDTDVRISPRFMFLHTLSHLLIRQLETEAGYPAASLKERIYCTTGKLPMAGILVYVAVPDVVGSLGGLSELALPERFLPLISGVFDCADWCSLDPVCSEHEGQGPQLLNRAACHACALVPEPSCAFGNVLLDRMFVRGDEQLDVPAFLDSVETRQE
jgi:hypothetical protein